MDEMYKVTLYHCLLHRCVCIHSACGKTFLTPISGKQDCGCVLYTAMVIIEGHPLRQLKCLFIHVFCDFGKQGHFKVILMYFYYLFLNLKFNFLRSK